MKKNDLSQYREDTFYKHADIPIVIGVSAHRNIDENYIKKIEEQVGNFLDEIKALCPHSPIYMLTGLAQGGDLLCARVAVTKGVKIIAALPFDEFDDKPYDNADDFNESALSEYRALINSEHTIKKFVVPDIENIPQKEYEDEPQSEIEKKTRLKERRAYKFRQQAIYVATNCHILLALWDGTGSKNSRLDCGTNMAVEFALKHDYFHPGGMEFFSPYIGAVAGIFSPRVGKVYNIKEEDFGYKYITTPDRVNNKYEIKNSVFERVNSDDKIVASRKMTQAMREVLVRTDAYNEDYQKYCKSLHNAKIRNEKKSPKSKNPKSGTGERESYLVGKAVYDSQTEIQAVHDCYRIASNLSGIDKNKYLWGIKLLSVFGVLLILSWMLYDQVAYRWTTFVCAFMVLVLVIGYAAVNFSEATKLAVKIKLKTSFNSHAKFVEYRALSEALRVQYYLLTLGITKNVSDLFAWGHKSEMAWVKMGVTVLIIGAPQKEWQSDVEKEVIENWIGKVEKNEDGSEIKIKGGQLGYHIGNSKKQRKKISTRNVINGIILGATFIMYAVLFISEFFGGINLDKSLIGVVNVRILLKCCFSVFTAITFVVSYNYSKLSLDQNERDSIHMVRLFQAALDRIKTIDEVYSKNEPNRNVEMQSLFVELARNQLIENGTWVAYNRDKGNDVPI